MNQFYFKIFRLNLKYHTAAGDNNFIISDYNFIDDDNDNYQDDEDDDCDVEVIVLLGYRKVFNSINVPIK